MDTIFRQAILFDIYGELLTEKQREALRLHLQEDWSLSEIAAETGISRQGVSDAIGRGLKTLEELEQKLHMAERFVSLSQTAEEIRNLLYTEEPNGQDMKSQKNETHDTDSQTIDGPRLELLRQKAEELIKQVSLNE